MKHLVIALIVSGLCGPLLAQSGKLVVPSGGELDSFVRKESWAACAQCGIVVSIKTLATAEPERKAFPAGKPTPNSVAIQPLPVGGKEARAERKKMRQPLPDTYQITVHNADDTYSIIEQAEQPDFAKGDRVLLVDGKLQRF